LVERLLCKQDVAGSTPVISTKNLSANFRHSAVFCYNSLMFTFSGFLVGLTMVILGVLGVKYTFWIHNQTGPIGFIEKYAGSGSTYGVLKILFTFLVILGILWGSGFGHNVMSFFLSPIANMFTGGKQ
jgi:hypothetical protein